MAALEFDSLLAHWTEQSTPRKAEERVHKAIVRALQEGWSFRRIQEFCREAKPDKRGEAEAHDRANIGVGEASSPASNELSAGSTGVWILRAWPTLR